MGLATEKQLINRKIASLQAFVKTKTVHSIECANCGDKIFDSDRTRKEVAEIAYKKGFVVSYKEKVFCAECLKEDIWQDRQQNTP